MSLILVSWKKEPLDQNSHGQVFFRPIQYPRAFGYLHCYKPWLGCSIESGRIVTLGKSLHGYAQLDEVSIFRRDVVVCFSLFCFFQCWNSFFFSFHISNDEEIGTSWKQEKKKSKTFLVRITRAISTSVIWKREMLKRYSFLAIQEQENSRVDIIEPTKILEHAIAETHVISRFTTKKPILFRLRPQRAIACLPCHVPMVPGRGEGSWAGITPFADWSRFEQTQRRGHWWRIEIGQRQLRFEGRRNVIAVSRS